jgi:hypothetical protein
MINHCLKHVNNLLTVHIVINMKKIEKIYSQKKISYQQ